MELKAYQQEAVNNLVKNTKKYLKGDAKTIYLKAPTGAGKTVMASAAMEEIAATLPFEYDGIFNKVAFIWIAPNKLHVQSYLSMKSYFKYTNNMRPIVWDEIDHTIGHLEHGNVLFLNWESINKDSNRIRQTTETDESLFSIVNNTRDEHIAIVLIIDEEHQGASKNAKQAQKVLAGIRPDIEIRISATPKPKGDYCPIFIDRDDVVREQMIKKDVIINAGFDAAEAEGFREGQKAFFIKKALEKREALKEMYALIGNPVNPLLLIQLPNNNEKLDSKDKEIMAIVKEYLANPEIDITETNEKLAIWLSKDKKNLDKIAEPNNMTEVLIFKEAISKGWDCPRAAVLLIFRQSRSEAFTVQTVGRIMRMPQQKHYSNDALNHGYVYTDVENEYIEIEADDASYIQNGMQEAIMRSNITPLSLQTENIGIKKEQNALNSRFHRILRETFIEKWDLNQTTLNFASANDEVSDLQNLPVSGELFSVPGLTEEQKANRTKLVQNVGLDLDVHRLYSVFPKDMTIDPSREGRYEVPANGRVSVAKTQGEVDRLFKNFCLANLIRFDKRDSTDMMAGAIVKFMNMYTGYVDDDVKRIVLFHKNRPKFVSVLIEAQKRYEKDLADRMEKAKTKLQKYTWTMPSSRAYKMDTHRMVDAPGHALQPFYELENASDPEVAFRDFLNKHSDHILWWYKNGDKGKEHFSILYKNTQGQDANFYVDFIIMLRNERLCLFDTKSYSGDAESVNKHNALIDYIDRLNKANQTNYIGGIIIQDHGQWLYSPLHISDASDHGGWSTFNPEELNK